jgi:hypothetical protein
MSGGNASGDVGGGESSLGGVTKAARPRWLVPVAIVGRLLVLGGGAVAFKLASSSNVTPPAVQFNQASTSAASTSQSSATNSSTPTSTVVDVSGIYSLTITQGQTCQPPTRTLTVNVTVTNGTVAFTFGGGLAPSGPLAGDLSFHVSQSSPDGGSVDMTGKFDTSGAAPTVHATGTVLVVSPPACDLTWDGPKTG